MNSSQSNEMIKILTFSLNDDVYAINIENIRQLFRIEELEKWKIANSTLPSLKYFFRFQDEILPMVDMRLKFNLEFREYNTETPVVLLNLDSMLIGFIVDSVFNVNNFSVSQLQFLPKFYYINNKQFFESAFITNDQIACMLNVDNILTLSEADYLKRVSLEAARKIQSSGKE